MFTHIFTLNVVDCTAGGVYNPFSETCITLKKSKESWFDADEACRNESSYLLTLKDLKSIFWFRNLRQTNNSESSLFVKN